MTSGPRRAPSRLCAIAVLALVLATGTVAVAQPLDAADLLASLAQVARSSATFEETRTLAALTAPIVRRGR